MVIKSILMDEVAIKRAVTRIAHEICERNQGVEGLCLIGIKRRGDPLAKRLANCIEEIEGHRPPVTAITISNYRDDGRYSQEDLISIDEEIPFSIEDCTIILVDDVLYTGRSCRAAIEALFDLGRPASVQLACLIDRGHRELPIRPDFIGKNVPTSHQERIVCELKEIDGEDRVLIATLDSNVKETSTCEGEGK